MLAPPYTIVMDVGGWRVLQALVVATMVVVMDKGVDPLPESIAQVVVFQQDAVLQGMMPPFAPPKA